MSRARHIAPYLVGAAVMLAAVLILGAVRSATAGNTVTGRLAGKIVTGKALFTVGIGKFDSGIAQCPAGTAEISGGYQVTSGNFVYVTASGPAKGSGWYVSAFVPNAIAEPGVSAAKIAVVAYCAKPGEAVIAR